MQCTNKTNKQSKNKCARSNSSHKKRFIVLIPDLPTFEEQRLLRKKNKDYKNRKVLKGYQNKIAC